MDTTVHDLSDRLDILSCKRGGFLVNARSGKVCKFDKKGDVFIIAVFTGESTVKLDEETVYSGSSPALIQLSVKEGAVLSQEGGRCFRAIVIGDEKRADSLRLTGDGNPYFACVGDGSAAIYSIGSGGEVTEASFEAFSGASYIDFCSDGDLTAAAYVINGKAFLSALLNGEITDTVELGRYRTVSVSLSDSVAALVCGDGTHSCAAAYVIVGGGIFEVSAAEDIGSGDAVVVKGDPYTVYQNISGEIYKKQAVSIALAGKLEAIPLLVVRE